MSFSKLITYFLFTVILTISSLASAEEVYIRNASYGKPGIDYQYVVVSTTNNPEYYRYTNARFAYSIQLSRNFNLARSSANSSGCSFLAEDGAIFNVYGMHNSIYPNATAAYGKELSEHPYATYHTCGDTWYVITYAEGDNLVYKKTFINSQYINEWSISFPKYLLQKYSPIIEHIEPTFIPTWKTGLKIWG